MKIFKNRGDIYISKSGYKSSREERILLSLLAIIVIFTIVFLVIMSSKYSSAKEFFADGEISTTAVEENTDNVLPDISGKTNFVIMETDEQNQKLHYVYLVQADSDSLAYKVSALSPATKIDNDSISSIYADGGGANVQARLTEYFNFEIDYYISFKASDFVEFANKLGSFVYTSPQQVKFDKESENDAYSIRIKAGESNIDGKDLSNLLRYYSVDKPNYTLANEALLYGLKGCFNAENYDDCDSLFRLLISHSSTNITVRDFENAKPSLEVFCIKNADITAYPANAEYQKKVLTQNAVKEIKGYFSK